MNVTIYIRKTDEAKWKALKDKAQFIHDALNSVDIKAYNKAVAERKEILEAMRPYLDTDPNFK